MHHSDPDHRPDLPEPAVRPRRVVRLPSYLSDFELTDHQRRLQSRQKVDTYSEMSDDSENQGATAAKLTNTFTEYGTGRQPWQPLTEWSHSREYEQQRAPTSHIPELSSQVLAEFQQLRKETEELRRHSYEQIQRLKEKNEALETQLSLLAMSDRTSHYPHRTSSPVPQPRANIPPVTTDARPIPLPRSKLPPRPNESAADSLKQDRLHDFEQRLRQLEMISPATHARPSQHQSFPHRSNDRADDRSIGYNSTQLRLPSNQESTYRGPAPTIPNFVKPDPREFSRLRIALENILPADATERFKYQILVDHLKLEEALLIADSYCNSLYPLHRYNGGT